MVHRALIIIAWVCCFFVVASFSMFAIDELSGASKHQQNEITSYVVQPVAPEAKHHGQPRQFIDDVAHTLTSPFRSIVQSDSQWVLRGIPSIVALLVYGVGIGYLARFSRGLS